MIAGSGPTDRDWNNPHVLFGTSRYPIDVDGLILSHAGVSNEDSGECPICGNEQFDVICSDCWYDRSQYYTPKQMIDLFLAWEARWIAANPEPKSD